MAAHPIAVGQVHDQRAARGERPLHRLEDGDIVLLAVEIAEGIAEDADAVKAALRHAELAGIALVERKGEVPLAGALAREPDEIARAVDAGDLLEAAAGQLERVATLTAAEVENAVVGLEPGAPHQQLDLLLGIAIVFDDVAVGLEVERVEERAPPVVRQMALEIGDRAEGPRRRRLRLPERRLRRLCLITRALCHPRRLSPTHSPLSPPYLRENEDRAATSRAQRAL